MKDIEACKKYIARHEGVRRETYYDTAIPPHPTIGIGFNLDRSGAKPLIERFGLDFTELRKVGCELLCMETAPTCDCILMYASRAYILVGDELFYLHKVIKKIESMVLVSATLELFKEKLKPTTTSRILTDVELKEITKITSHGHTRLSTLNDDQINTLFEQDLLESIAGAKRFFPGFDDLSAMRQIVLVDMSFNLGYAKLCKFLKFNAALAGQDYDTAAKEMANSAWAKQVKIRGEANIIAMRTDTMYYSDIRLSVEVPYWVSTDTSMGGGHRWQLEIRGDNCTWIEFNSGRQEFQSRVKVIMTGDGHCSIERPNNREILKFLGANDKAIEQILETNPKPSVLIFSRSADQLIAS